MAFMQVGARLPYSRTFSSSYAFIPKSKKLDPLLQKEMLPQRLGEVRVLSKSTCATPLPALREGDKPTVPSFYLRSDVECLSLSAECGIVGDQRAVPSHQTRQRDILFADPALLREVGSIHTNKSLQSGTHDKPCNIGQNVTLAEGDVPVSTWCVGDMIEIGSPDNAALVRITSTRRPCPKNNNVHGEGTGAHMDKRGLGGIFGTVVRDGIIRPGDAVMLVERLQSQWTCAQELQEIVALEYLEGPRYKSVAQKRLKELEALAASSRWQWEAFALLAVSIVAVQVFRRWNVGAR